MRRIDRTAAKYRAMGHAVRVLSATRCEVTDSPSGHVYRVGATGRAVVGRELAAEIAAEADDPNYVGPE